MQNSNQTGTGHGPNAGHQAAQRAAMEQGFSNFNPQGSGYASAENVQRFMTRVFGWMAMGLALTALIAWLTFSNGYALDIALSGFMPVLFIGELAIVWFLAARVHKMPVGLATGMFLFYSVLNGVTLSTIFLAYNLGTIGTTFLITAMTFGFMFVFGWVTKRDLTKVGSLAFMALIGIIVASVVNFFVQSELMGYIISYAGVLIFVALTAWDAQKIKRLAAAGHADSDMQQRAAILGALTLYLDFVNLFIFFLRIFGGRD